jgi:hypothetical protein
MSSRSALARTAWRRETARSRGGERRDRARVPSEPDPARDPSSHCTPYVSKVGRLPKGRLRSWRTKRTATSRAEGMEASRGTRARRRECSREGRGAGRDATASSRDSAASSASRRSRREVQPVERRRHREPARRAAAVRQGADDLDERRALPRRAPGQPARGISGTTSSVPLARALPRAGASRAATGRRRLRGRPRCGPAAAGGTAAQRVRRISR